MRIRARTLNKTGSSGSGFQKKWWGPPYNYWGDEVNLGSGTVNYPCRTDHIADETNLPLDGQVKRKEQRRKSELNHLLSKTDNQFRLAHEKDNQISYQVHRCVHTKTVVSPADVIVKTRTGFGDSYLVATLTKLNGSIFGLHGIPDPLTSGAWNVPHYTAGPYQTPDWFALLNSFNEASNSLVPSSTLLGESIYENGIFFDAFKIMLNPTSAARVLCRRLKKVYKRGMTLGGLRKTTKDGANAYLGYQFGVRPAINEVRNALSAHANVSNRLAYLRRNTGGFVPIRVRSELSSPVVNTSFSGKPDGSLVLQCDHRKVTATIGAWAKVREDLNYESSWQAYVQYFGLHKVVGLAWELVPMSFVIDWFLDVEDFINKTMTPRFSNPFYNIRGICHSVKEETKLSLYAMPLAYLGSGLGWVVEPNEPYKLGSKTTSVYTRLPSLPTSSGFVDFSNLGLFHGTTLGIMLLQKKL